jgi:hypothetical protein
MKKNIFCLTIGIKSLSFPTPLLSRAPPLPSAEALARGLHPGGAPYSTLPEPRSRRPPHPPRNRIQRRRSIISTFFTIFHPNALFQYYSFTQI